MKLRFSALVGILFAIFLGIFLLAREDNDPASAKTVPDEILPTSSVYFEGPTDLITDEQRQRINVEIQRNLERLEREGRLEPARPEAVPLAWPIQKAAGVTDFQVDAISNYVDHNLAFPNQVRDWNCGARTYDSNTGYNHPGIDIYTWPFTWKKVDDNAVEIIAAAPGTIIFKSDGNFDRSCSLNSNDWNAVYIRHSDNSIAWYGHMKNGSQTTKAVGQTVALGEKLGIVGSSGNSTGPHLHFEVRNAVGQTQDPFQGPCNTMNTTGWWTAQEPYRNSRINALMTQSGPPIFPACPITETTNQKSTFQPGETIYVVAYFRDPVSGLQSQYSLIAPDGSTYQNWSYTAPITANSSGQAWTWTLPLNAPQGNWKVRAVLNSVTSETPFVFGSPFASVTGRVTTPTGLGLRNAVVSLIDSTNVTRTATTSSFGIYTFNNVATGGTYTMTVASKRFRFSPRSLQIGGNLTGIDFTGME